MSRVSSIVVYNVSTKQGEILTFPVTLSLLSVYSGVFIPMVFEHSGGGDFDLPRHSKDTLTTQGLSLWSLNIVRKFGHRQSEFRTVTAQRIMDMPQYDGILVHEYVCCDNMLHIVTKLSHVSPSSS